MEQPNKNAMTCVREISVSVSDAIKALPAIRRNALQIFRHSHYSRSNNADG
jgi:hypothetical protein